MDGFCKSGVNDGKGDWSKHGAMRGAQQAASPQSVSAWGRMEGHVLYFVHTKSPKSL